MGKHSAPEEQVFHVGAEPVLHIPSLLVSTGLAASTSAARCDIAAGSVRIDGRVVVAFDEHVSAVVGKTLASGKRRSVRIVRG